MNKEVLFKISRENATWFSRNYESLKKKYDNCWIMIHNKKVVESASSFDEIMNATKKYDRNTVMVEYIQSKPIAMFF